MNKLFTKITSLALGAAMMIGVGVAVGSKKVSSAEAAYEKATSIAAGDTVLLVYEKGKIELSGSSGTSTNYGKGASYSSTPAGVYPLTVEAGTETDTFSFKNGSSYLFWSTGNSLGFGSKGKNASWSVTFSSGDAVIANANDSSRKIRYNTGSPRFACYSSGQQAVQLYKQASSGTLSSISLNTDNVQKEFSVNDTFSYSGLVVTANYTNPTSSKTVTPTSVSSPDMSVAGEKTVTVTYTEGNTSKTATYKITVVAPPAAVSAKIVGTMTNTDYYVGDPYDVTGLSVRITYDNADTQDFALTSLTKGTDYLLDHDTAVLGDTTLDITGEYLGCEFDYTAEGITVSEAPSKATWDLSINSTSEATESRIAWTNSYADMACDKENSSTAANNYYPGTTGQNYKSTRFYKNSRLTITPKTDISIIKVEFTATTDNYASALHNSTWTNATSAVSSSKVTVTPTDGTLAFNGVISNTCGFTAVDVYYSEAEVQTYTVSFNKNGGSGNDMEDVEDVHGSYTLPDCTFIAPENKAFVGWKANDEGDLIAEGESYNVTSDVEFYAQWVNTYTVTYSAGTHGSGSYAHTQQPAGKYKLLSFESLNGITPSIGYGFASFTVNQETKNPGEEITISGNTSVTVNFSERSYVTTYNFAGTNFASYASEWENGYNTHENINGTSDLGGSYSATVNLYKASKQTGTITDKPVFATKTQAGSWTKVVGFTLTEQGYKITSVSVTFAQWGSKTPDIALFKGGEVSGQPLDTATIGTKNTLTTSNLNGVEFSIGYCDKDTGNVQSGISSITLNVAPVGTFNTLDHITITSLPNVVYHVGETYSSTGLTVTAYDGANESTANFKDVTALVQTSLDNPSAFDEEDVPGLDCTVSYSGDGGSDSKSFHVYVYALATYELVTSAPSDWSGNYLIVGDLGSNNLVAMNGGLSNVDNINNFKNVTASNNEITAGQELEWTISSYSTGYALKGKNNKYIGSVTKEGDNGLLSSDSPLLNTLALSGTSVTITGVNGTELKLNTSEGQERFRYYASGSVKLYKLKQSDKADLYAQYFLETLSTGENAVCKYDEETGIVSTDFDDLKAVWKTLATAYKTGYGLSSVEKEAFRLGVASESTNIGKAIALYDHIARAYNTRLQDSELTDYNFMERTAAQVQPRIISNLFSAENTPTTVIIIISVIGVFALGGFFFLRKRKEI